MTDLRSVGGLHMEWERKRNQGLKNQGLSWSCSLICRKPGLVNFLGGPMAKILCSQCRRPRFDPWSWN